MEANIPPVSVASEEGGPGAGDVAVAVGVSAAGGQPAAFVSRGRLNLGWLAGRRQMQLGLFILVVIAGAAALAPLIAPYNPVHATADILAPPSSAHIFGTDQSGLDVFSRTIYAPRVDMVIAVAATILAMVVGIPIGIFAGHHEGVIGETLARVFDIVQAFPFFILALILLGIFGPSEDNLIAVVAFVNAPIYFRLMKTQAQVLKKRTFVEAARVAGCRDRDLMFRHILPNSWTPALAQMSVTIAWSIILTAGVSFVGAGVRPPTPEWGVMIASGAPQMQTGQWWPAVFPGVSLALSVVGWALVGNAITEVVDPTRRHG